MLSAHDVIRADLAYVFDQAQEELAGFAGDRVLITGGAGFLGYYLVHTLLYWNTRHPDRPIEVILTDNFLRGEPDWVGPLFRTAHCRVLTWDVRQPWPSELPACSWVLHAASIASPIYYRKRPIETIEANITGLITLLHRCREEQERATAVKGMLFFSSSEIYGDPDRAHIPTAEDYNGNVSCTGPRACYDESKRLGETLCVSFARQHGLRVMSARPFNNYGPGLKISDRRVIPDFARNILTNEDIVLLSDGSPTRTFCYIADAVVGYLKILAWGNAGEAYNIGVAEPEISMYDLAHQLAGLGRELFGYRGKVQRQVDLDTDYLVDNPNRRCPVIDKARDELGYDPQIPLDDGLRRTLVWYNENRDGNDA